MWFYLELEKGPFRLLKGITKVTFPWGIKPGWKVVSPQGEPPTYSDRGVSVLATLRIVRPCNSANPLWGPVKPQAFPQKGVIRAFFPQFVKPGVNPRNLGSPRKLPVEEQFRFAPNASRLGIRKVGGDLAPLVTVEGTPG